MKFKVGDIVKGKNHCYTITNSRMIEAKVMSTYDCGMTIKVTDHIEKHRIGGEHLVANDDHLFELIKRNECIVIYRNSNEVVALNKATKEKAVAKCCPEDTFDFSVGARIAFDRLIGEEKKEPALYNGKVVCINVAEGMKEWYTVGKVYDVTEGRFNDNGGCITPDRVKDPAFSLEDLNQKCDHVTFAKLIEKENK